MNHLIVNKIGGSILKSPNQLKKTVSAINRQKSQSINVVSAIYGVTDLLIKSIKEPGNSKKHINTLVETHVKWITEAPNREKTYEILKSCKKTIELLKSDIKTIRHTDNPHLYAKILSYGERLAAEIVNSYFNNEASILLPEDINLTIENDAINGDYSSVKKLKFDFSNQKQKVFIIPGFYGINEAGKYCLAGRGGSDYTAAFIAQKTNTQELNFWKDSNGIQTANPEIVKRALNVDQVNLQILEALSIAGSEILHPKVTKVLKGFRGKVSFKNPGYGNKVLTNISTKNNTRGRAIIVDYPEKQYDTICSITIITRNIAAALIAIQQLKRTTQHLTIKEINKDRISFTVNKDDKCIAIRQLHQIFHGTTVNTPKKLLINN
jgi:aspartate kinase